MSTMTPFRIEWTYLRLPPGWSRDKIDRVKRIYFEAAARRWSYVIDGWPARVTDGQPLKLPGGRLFTAIEIQVNFDYFRWDVENDVVARVPASTLQRLKPSQAQPWNFPFLAALNVDMNDLEMLMGDPARFLDTIVHEVGHVLGLGTVWEDPVPGRKLVVPTDDGYAYVGRHAVEAYAALRKGATAKPPSSIALDLAEQEGTRSFHWSETDLTHEIMSTSLDAPTVATGSNAISAVSVGALQDLGYLVDPRAAERLVLASGAERAIRTAAPSEEGERSYTMRPGAAEDRTSATGRLSFSRKSSGV